MHGTILAISDQPYCLYQHAVLETILPQFIIETVGPETLPHEDFVVYLDTFARALYQSLRLSNRL